jgi:hypothetical protein
MWLHAWYMKTGVHKGAIHPGAAGFAGKLIPIRLGKKADVKPETKHYNKTDNHKP